MEKPKTILLADDETSAREVVKLLLESRGYAVITAVNGEDAVNKFHEHKENIDMLLFDVVMPLMNGKDAHDIIKKMKPDVKALLMSGYTNDIMLNKDLQKEGLHFLQKPFFPEKLFEKINEITGA